MRQHETLEKVIAPVVSGLGFDWVGMQYLPSGRRSLLRIYVDKPGGITIDECQRVSRQIEAALSVEPASPEDYILEVSSPGLDRLLFNPAQCHEQVGKLVNIRLKAPKDGQRNFKGRLQAVEGDQITILIDEKQMTFSFDEIDEARIVPEW